MVNGHVYIDIYHTWILWEMWSQFKTHGAHGFSRNNKQRTVHFMTPQEPLVHLDPKMLLPWNLRRYRLLYYVRQNIRKTLRNCLQKFHFHSPNTPGKQLLCFCVEVVRFLWRKGITNCKSTHSATGRNMPTWPIAHLVRCRLRWYFEDAVLASPDSCDSSKSRNFWDPAIEKTRPYRGTLPKN